MPWVVFAAARHFGCLRFVFERSCATFSAAHHNVEALSPRAPAAAPAAAKAATVLRGSATPSRTPTTATSTLWAESIRFWSFNSAGAIGRRDSQLPTLPSHAALSGIYPVSSSIHFCYRTANVTKTHAHVGLVDLSAKKKVHWSALVVSSNRVLVHSAVHRHMLAWRSRGQCWTSIVRRRRTSRRTS